MDALKCEWKAAMSNEPFDSEDDFDDEIMDFDDDESMLMDDDSGGRSQEAFLAEVQQRVNILKDARGHSSAERRAAAYWLGEVGEPTAIPTLLRVYQKDKKHPDVQKAAGYALGQFKALDQAVKRPADVSFDAGLERDENQFIVEILTNIVLYDDRGRRTRFPARRMATFSAVLTVTLLLLVAFNLLAVPLLRTEPGRYAQAFAALTGSPEQIALDALGILLSDARADADTLAAQFNAPSIDCTVPFNDPIAYPLDATVARGLPEANTLNQTYAAILPDLNAARLAFVTACAAETPGLSDTQRSAALDSLARVQAALTDADAQLVAANEALSQAVAQAGAEASATAAAQQIIDSTATALASITPTTTPTYTATPGIPPQDLRREVNDMLTRLENAEEALLVLTTNWEQVRDEGRTLGCNAPRPFINADDYLLPEGYGALEPDLQTASDLVNAGVALTRASWASFETACTNNTLAGNFITGLATTDTAQQSFDQAKILLNQLLGLDPGSRQPTATPTLDPNAPTPVPGG